MKKVSLLMICFIAFYALNVNAQFGPPGGGGPKGEIKIISGDLKFLKGATDLKIDYNYEDLKVGDMNEDDYIVKHMAEMEKAKSGSSADWKVKWVEDRQKKYQPGFEKYFVKAMSKAKIFASSSNDKAKYTIIIKTIKIEPGLYTGVTVVAKKTYVDAVAIFVETGNPSNELCRIAINKFIGDAGDFASYDMSMRIQASYYTIGNKLGGFIIKNLKKIK